MSTEIKLTPIPDGVRQLLDEPNYVHLTTLRSDGSPRSHVVWVMREEDKVIVGTGPTNRKARDMDRDPRVALSLVDLNNPYRMASLRGVVSDVRPDDRLKLMDRMGRKYTEQPFPGRNVEIVYYVIGITSVYERTLHGFTHSPEPVTR
jgi:PPOX class probable F420-dependent enzyme